MTLNDPLKARMKALEKVTSQALPRRTWTLVRLDGSAFHTYTRDLQRPFDPVFAADMDAAAAAVAQMVSGAAFAYVQSDEISLLMTDFATTTTTPWFGGSVQKLVSVTASMATAIFNQRRLPGPNGPGLFDARVFTLPDVETVAAYFMWRQRDASLNSISMAASAHFSHAQLKGLSVFDRRELLLTEAGVDWRDYSPGFRNGRVVTRQEYTERADAQARAIPHDRSGRSRSSSDTPVRVRTRWASAPAPRFTEAADEWLMTTIPVPRQERMSA